MWGVPLYSKYKPIFVKTVVNHCRKIHIPDSKKITIGAMQLNRIDTVFHNGVIATMDNHLRTCQAVALTDGKIVAVGTEKEIMELCTAKTERIDLHGRFMIPGLHDSHLHAADFVNNLEHLACDQMDTISGLQAAVRKRYESDHAGWILGNGLSQGVLDAGLSRKDLDLAAPDVPTVIIMWHGHGCVANTAALKQSGITADTPDPSGGIIRREPDGTPSGVLEEASALQLVFAGMRSFTADEIAEKLQKMQHIMNKMGYTGYTESTVGPANNTREGGASGEECLKAYVKLAREHKMTCRVAVGFYSGRNGSQSYAALKEDIESGRIPTSPDEEMLTFKMLKFFCDGVETSHTAWMKTAYADAPGLFGSCVFGPEGLTEDERIEELRNALKLANDSGYQIGIHTVGDRAVHEALEAIIAAQTANRQDGIRHCLIHADNLGDCPDLLRCPAYDIVVSAQPNLAAGMFLRDAVCVGETVAARMAPHRVFIDHGLVISGGSDSVAGEFHDWRAGIYSAVTRMASNGKPFHPEYAVTVAEALKMFTYNAAYQEMCEDKRGSIECGKYADFTVLDKNLFEIDPAEILNVNVCRTVVGGKTVYQAE